MPGVLPHTPMVVERGSLKLTLTGRIAASTASAFLRGCASSRA